MKILNRKSLVLMFFSLMLAFNTFAQKEETTQISYKVDFGPVYPIEGTSNSIVGNASVNDTTGAFETLGFDVDINTFFGQNSGYLGWIGNSWQNPDMTFKSSSIAIKGNQLIVDGTLEFRRQRSFVQMNLTQKETNNSVVLQGDFTLNTNDFFIVAPHRDLVPTWIPFKITLVFDKALNKQMTTKN